MRVRTAERARDERRYLSECRLWLEARCCARCGTDKRIEVHHRRGRRGSLLLDQAWWVALGLAVVAAPVALDWHTWRFNRMLRDVDVERRRSGLEPGNPEFDWSRVRRG